ncbi:DUF4974 domain-containing protein [Sphingobacterium alkalisoli]|uniref:DUF4974 domain-containing protein n=1 Tax=Sphingobacterium alkalisoli TaxID=1874115 RepID=A0A4U0GR98_9SPHI|nr:FecR domain-containing protein [Sphingobacterium alkalisoli]TJY61423.1 DUF4974 domain-containing protein [Sphingobacterium alkalisoli]GGH30483.1 hypothetical protein GCM10011418_42560 [Sphingobacterium alkalisoli]
MKNHNLDVLIDKYLQGIATEEERAYLHEWYRSQDGDIIWKVKDEQEEQAIRARLRENIWKEAQISTAPPVLQWRKWVTVAAAVLLVALVSIWWSREANRIDDVENLIAATPLEQVENRFILLPDSSRVILRPGSRLEYRTNFKGATREVDLVGEAYFDINHKADQPFIIHTGKVKTVVLGTAFTIKTDSEQNDVQVTVQRGKVRVERETDHIQTDLVADQQIRIEAEVSTPKAVQVSAERTMEWTAQDVRFDNQSFGELAAKLERRYDLNINFKNQNLANCPVSGRFNGGETIDEVLSSLCATRNATFKISDTGSVEINGTGCPKISEITNRN